MSLLAGIKNFIFQPQEEYVEIIDEIVEDDYDYVKEADKTSHFHSRERRVDRTTDTVVLPTKKGIGKSGTSGEIYSMPGIKDNHIIISTPENIDMAGGISDFLKMGKTVIVKMEDTDVKDAQRIMDFLSGVVHCINGEVHEVTSRIFVVAPKNMEVTEHLKEHLKANGIFAGFNFRSSSKSG
jgi:cell division inhibitor SepF